MATQRKPKKKTTTVIEEIPAGPELTEGEEEPTELDFSLEEIRTAEQLTGIMEQFPDAGITAKLYDEKGAFCYRIPDPASIDEEIVRKRCGGGDFHIRLYVNGKFRQTIPLPIRALTEVDSHTNGNGGSDHHSQFLEKALIVLLEKHASTAPAAAGPTITDLTTALANLDALRGKQESGMDFFTRGLEFAQKLNGETDWKTDAVRMAKDAVPSIVQAISGVRGAQPGPAGGTPVPVVEGGEQTAMGLPPEAVIKQGLVYLKKKCIGGTDPNLIIDWISDNADDPQYQILLHAVFTMDFADIAKFDPEIGTGPFLPWFKQLYDGLRSAFSTANSMDVDSGGSVGDDNNVRNDGKPSANGVKK